MEAKVESAAMAGMAYGIGKAIGKAYGIHHGKASGSRRINGQGIRQARPWARHKARW